jgi:preprotein translocase SecF subunit
MSALGGIGGRLYRGEVSIEFVSRQRLWYTISGVILAVSIIALAVFGLNFSVDFKGGSVFQFPAGTATISQVRTAVSGAGGGSDAIVQQVANAQKHTASWTVQTHQLTPAQRNSVESAIARTFRLTPDQISVQYVGASWGSQISRKALQALIAFLVVIVIYLSIAFEWKMAAAALIALAHDIVITIGVYALLGFQVSPASVIGLLTILGYSLYDTVVVFDKVRENTAGLLGSARATYGPVHQHLGHRAAAGGRDPVHRRGPARRGRAEGPGAGAVRGHAVGHLLLDLHRDPGPGRPQGAGAAVQGARQAGLPACGRRARRQARGRQDGSQERDGRGRGIRERPG